MVDPDDSGQEWIANKQLEISVRVDQHFRRQADIMITRVSKVIVPVEDQQAALDFWTRYMKFSTVRDDSYGEERWIEVKQQGLRFVRARGILSQSKANSSTRTERFFPYTYARFRSARLPRVTRM
jgi:hypothetical protein